MASILRRLRKDKMSPAVDRKLAAETVHSLSTPARVEATRRPSRSPAASGRNPLSPASGANLPGYEEPPSYSTSTVASEVNPFAFLSSYDTVFLIDNSGSMAGRSWRETEAALVAIAPICTAYDKDGIDIYFLNKYRDQPQSYTNVTTPQAVTQIFGTVKPWGGTPTGARLKELLHDYMERLKLNGPNRTKRLNIIVITDGAPSDPVEQPIIQVTKDLDSLQQSKGWDLPDGQIGIQFFQVGSDTEATITLQWLDDDLMNIGATRDIVDTVPWKDDTDSMLSAEGLLKVVAGSVQRRQDRKRNSAENMRV